MPDPAQDSSPSTPAWALRQATDELDYTDDPELIAGRAEDLAAAAQELEDERHDEYDDPDEGGEA